MNVCRDSLAVLTALLLLTACTSMPEDRPEPREEKVYRTGSNLPSKDYGDVKVIDPEAVRDARRIGTPRSLGKP